MDYTTIASVITAMISLVAVAIGVKYRQLRERMEHFKELVVYFVEAWEDDRLSAEEIEGLVRRGKALVEPEDEP